MPLRTTRLGTKTGTSNFGAQSCPEGSVYSILISIPISSAMSGEEGASAEMGKQKTVLEETSSNDSKSQSTIENRVTTSVSPPFVLDPPRLSHPTSSSIRVSWNGLLPTNRPIGHVCLWGKKAGKKDRYRILDVRSDRNVLCSPDDGTIEYPAASRGDVVVKGLESRTAYYFKIQLHYSDTKEWGIKSKRSLPMKTRHHAPEKPRITVHGPSSVEVSWIGLLPELENDVVEWVSLYARKSSTTGGKFFVIDNSKNGRGLHKPGQDGQTYPARTGNVLVTGLDPDTAYDFALAFYFSSQQWSHRGSIATCRTATARPLVLVDTNNRENDSSTLRTRPAPHDQGPRRGYSSSPSICAMAGCSIS